jgi:hypothetical protein
MIFMFKITWALISNFTESDYINDFNKSPYARTHVTHEVKSRRTIQMTKSSFTFFITIFKSIEIQSKINIPYVATACQKMYYYCYISAISILFII